MILRYLRVSTIQQDHLREIYLLDRLGVKFDKTFSDIKSGKTLNREGLQQMLKEAKAGDIIYCESVSRLSRDLNDLMDLINYFTNNNIKVVFVREEIDTEDPKCRKLIKIFGNIAAIERANVIERTREKVEALKYERETTGEIKTKSGKWFGRQEKTKAELPADFKKYYNKMLRKQINKTEMSKLLGVTRKTLYRWIDLYEEKEVRY